MWPEPVVTAPEAALTPVSGQAVSQPLLHKQVVAVAVVLATADATAAHPQIQGLQGCTDVDPRTASAVAVAVVVVVVEVVAGVQQMAMNSPQVKSCSQAPGVEIAVARSSFFWPFPRLVFRLPRSCVAVHLIVPVLEYACGRAELR
jgi:xanthine dehydrogenase iron-sulfur cluster and FAD-binding subunit A